MKMLSEEGPLIKYISAEQASKYFYRLPEEKQLVTLSPHYLLADAARNPFLEPAFILYEDERGFWMHGVNKAKIKGTAYFDLESAYGYGGPLSSCEEPSFLVDAWEEYRQFCHASDIVVEFVRLHPLVCQNAYLGKIIPNRDTVMIDVRSQEWRSGYAGRCRRDIGKARKLGMQVCETSLQQNFSKFGDFYRGAMKRIGADEFYSFSDDYFWSLSRVPGVTLLVSEYQGNWVSAIILLFGPDVVEYHLSATTDLGRSLRATNLLIDLAAQYAWERNRKIFYLGGGTDDAPDNPLLRFKAGFSSLRLTYSYAYAVHNEDFYSMLRARAGYEGNRVLFYR